MDAKRWEQIEALFEAALEREPQERNAWLEQECGDDRELLNEILILLEADKKLHSLLRLPAVDAESVVEEVLQQPTSIGKFEIVRHIGTGGMGTVLLAKDCELGRQVAIKMLPAVASQNARLRSRFLREAQAAARLNHPNIVTIFEIGNHAGLPYLAMEFVEGQTLREKIKAREITPVEAIDYIRQIAAGLKKAHEHGIVHRDIKPDNLIVDQDGRVKILDFGIAKVQQASPLTTSVGTIGTATYMSPEQAKGEAVDHRSDIFSLGVVFFELLTFVSPFLRDNIPASLHAIVHDSLPDRNQRYRELPAMVQKIIAQMTAKQPEERYSQMNDLQHDLSLSAGESGSGSFATASGLAGGSPLPFLAVQALAVLPFRSQSSEDDAFLAYGLTEDIIIELTRQNQLHVTAFRAVLPFAGSSESPATIGRQLGVDLIVDGSVRVLGEKVQVSIELIQARSESNRWAGRWKSDRVDLQQIKAEITAALCKEIGVSDATGHQPALAVAHEFSAEAYEFYLRGRFVYDHKKTASDVDVALGLFKQALRVDRNLTAARAGVADTLIFKGQLGEAEAWLIESLAEIKPQEKPSEAATLVQRRGQLLSRQGKWREALIQFESARDLLKTIHDPETQANLLGDMIAALLPLGEFDRALQLFDLVLDLNHERDDSQKVAEALKAIGSVYRHKADYDNADYYYEKALVAARNQSNLKLEASCLANMGNVQLCRNNLDRSLKHYEAALDMSRTLDDSVMIGGLLTNLAHVWDCKGNYRRALSLLQDASALQKENREPRSFIHLQTSLTEIQLKLGALDQAETAARKAFDESEAINYKSGIVSALLLIGSIKVAETDYTEASSFFDRALKMAIEGDLRREQALAHLGRGEIAVAIGNKAVAIGELEKAIVIARGIGDSGAALTGEIYLVLMQITESNKQSSLDRLESLAKDALISGAAETSLLADRLRGQLLLASEDSIQLQEQGIQILQATAAKAKEQELAIQFEAANQIIAEYEQNRKPVPGD